MDDRPAEVKNVLLDVDRTQPLAGEDNGLLSGYGRDMTLPAENTAWVTFIAAAVLPAPPGQPSRPTPPGTHHLRIGRPPTWQATSAA